MMAVLTALPHVLLNGSSFNPPVWFFFLPLLHAAFGSSYNAGLSRLSAKEKYGEKKGQRAVLLGRCIPIIRSLISVPAGMAGMKMPGFLLYTIVGSTVWNLLLVGIGAAVGAAWEQAAEYVKLYADVVFLILMVGTVCFPAFHLYRKKHRQK